MKQVKITVRRELTQTVEFTVQLPETSNGKLKKKMQSETRQSLRPGMHSLWAFRQRGPREMSPSHSNPAYQVRCGLQVKFPVLTATQVSAFVVDFGDDECVSRDDGQLNIVRAFHLGRGDTDEPAHD